MRRDMAGWNKNCKALLPEAKSSYGRATYNKRERKVETRERKLFTVHGNLNLPMLMRQVRQLLTFHRRLKMSTKLTKSEAEQIIDISKGLNEIALLDNVDFLQVNGITKQDATLKAASLLRTFVNLHS